MAVIITFPIAHTGCFIDGSLMLCILPYSCSFFHTECCWFNHKPHQKNPTRNPTRNPKLENPTRKSNSKIQLEILTRKLVCLRYEGWKTTLRCSLTDCKDGIRTGLSCCRLFQFIGRWYSPMRIQNTGFTDLPRPHS